MRRQWRYVAVGLVLVSLLSVGITEAYRSAETGPESATADRDVEDCESGSVDVIEYDGDPPESTDYGNLTDEQQRTFDAARTATNGTARVTVDASVNISEVDYVVYENRTYFVRNYIADCPWNEGSGGEDDQLETALVPFFVIDRVVGLLWLPVAVVVGLYVGYRKWVEWIQFG